MVKHQVGVAPRGCLRRRGKLGMVGDGEVVIPQPVEDGAYSDHFGDGPGAAAGVVVNDIVN